MYLFGILYTLPYFIFNNIKYEYINRILSTINSLYISIATICFQNKLIEYSVLNYAVKTSTILFASDIMYMYLTNYNTTLYYIHHIITISVILSGVTDYINPEYISIMFLTEITSVFINMSWYLNITNTIEKYKKTTMCTIILIVISWVYYRIYNIIKLIILMALINSNDSIYIPIPITYLSLYIY